MPAGEACGERLFWGGLIVLAVLLHGVVAVAVAVYVVHGVTHLSRGFGLYSGGGTPIPTRSAALEMRDGLQLLAPATAMALFFP